MALHKSKITSYYENDPRYSFTIKDSDEYNTPALPFNIRQKYTIHDRSFDPILRAGCDGQRYEHCVQDPFDDKYISCDTQFTTQFDDVPSDFEASRFVPKKMNNNTFYSDTRISKLENPHVVIDYSPDTPELTYDVNRSDIKKSNNSDNRIEKMTNNSDILEHCVSLGITKGGSCGKCGPICCSCLPPWFAPEDSCLLCLCLCLMCICFPCIISCINTLSSMTRR